MNLPPAIVDALSKVKLPPKLATTIASLMDIAEHVFGPGTGAQKKAWVIETFNALAKQTNLKAIPDWIENPVKEFVVDLVVEVVWELLYKPTASSITAAG